MATRGSRRREPPTPLPDDIACLTLPAPTIGSVNAWLLEGDPLTLVDTGPAGATPLAVLERALARRGRRVEDLEQVLLTHHHVDHCGLAQAIADRSGAAVLAIEPLAAYGARFPERNAASARYTAQLLAHHGVPAALVDASATYWRVLRDHGAPFTCDRALRDGDAVRAGGRELEVLHRPGHCSTDTLFVDRAARLALVGDHVLTRFSGCELEPPADGAPRPHALATYLGNLQTTAALGIDVALGGHGPPVEDPAAAVARHLDVHERRMARLLELLEARPAPAWELATRLFGERTAQEQTVLVVWDTLGHLDVLAERHLVVESTTGDGVPHFISCAGASRTESERAAC